MRMFLWISKNIQNYKIEKWRNLLKEMGNFY